MLLELKDLARSLSAANVTASQTDDHLVLYPNKPLFEIALDANGQVAGMRYVVREDGTRADRFQRLRKYECSKGGSRESTPGFNVDPLFQPREGEDDKAFRKEVTAFQKALKAGKVQTMSVVQERLEKLFASCESNWTGREKTRDKTIDKCLKDAARVLSDQLAAVAGHDAKALAPMRELLRRSQLLDAGRLHQQLMDHAKRAVIGATPGSNAEQFLQVLFVKPASIILELADRHRYEYPANHETVWQAVNRVLVEATSLSPVADSTGGQERMGVFGEPAPVNDSKMPERKLPRLGPVKLRSMTKNALCQARYGLTEDNACPVGSVVREELAAGLEWVTHPQREKKTWSDVSDSCGFDKSAVLVAYPSTLPADPPGLSAFLAGPGRSDIQAADRFEAFAQTLTERLQGIVRAEPRTTVRVFVLVKADRARTKLLYSRQYTVQRVLSAAVEWQNAARNLPPIFIRQFNEAGAPCWRVPLTPFPAKVVWCLNTCWLKAASENKRVSGLTIGDSLTLLLDSGPNLTGLAVQALRQALANCSPLLLALAQSHQMSKVFRVSNSLEAQPLLLPAILGLLLAKLGSFRESYMNDNPYLIGRLLSLADGLHRNYCKHERDGKLPPQLLGNALMPTALENPAAGLARLSERLPLYYRVAETALRADVAEVERAIDRTKLTDRCSDVEKAQMLLGYLARPDLLNSGSTENSPQEGEQS